MNCGLSEIAGLIATISLSAGVVIFFILMVAGVYSKEITSIIREIKRK